MNDQNLDQNDDLMKGDIDKNYLMPNNKKSYLKYIIIFIVLFIVVCLVIFIFFILKEKEKEEEKTETKCKPGEFFPDDDPKKCEKCAAKNCEICKGTKKNNICISCFENYYLVNGECK